MSSISMRATNEPARCAQPTNQRAALFGEHICQNAGTSYGLPFGSIQFSQLLFHFRQRPKSRKGEQTPVPVGNLSSKILAVQSSQNWHRQHVTCVYRKRRPFWSGDRIA